MPIACLVFAREISPAGTAAQLIVKVDPEISTIGELLEPKVDVHSCERSGDGGKSEWRWESWPSPRPLYHLHELAVRQFAPVVVCEGEKAADAAMQLLPDFVAVSSPNGSKSARKADWSEFKGRLVFVWPDADAAGL